MPTLREDGFVVLPELLSGPELAGARRHADDLLGGVPWSDNDFDGRRTRRVYSLLSRPGAFEPLLLRPEVHRLVSGALGTAYQIGMLFLTAVDPGQGAQPLHFDAGVYPLPRDVEAEFNVIWALDDFTADNGATPELRRLAGVAPASEYLGFVAGQNPERWLQENTSA